MIESLETRRLLSKTPLLLYPAPNSVATDALSIINATPAEVVASAAQNVGSGQAPSQAMLDLIEYHEGYSLSIYPDASGVPTVGVGLKLEGSNATTAATALNAAGVSYSGLVQDWNNIKSLWVSQHHPLGSLKDTSPLWARFVEQNPSVADPVLTSSQASMACNSAVTTKLAAAAAFFGSQFYRQDRDPQLALVDLAYHVADITKFKSLAHQIDGENTGYFDTLATDYALAATQFTSAGVGSYQHARDDQELMKHGGYPSNFGTPASATLAMGQNAALLVNPENAFSQSIILPPSVLKCTNSAAHIVSFGLTKNDLELHAVRQGMTDLTLTDRTTRSTETAVVTVAPPSQVTWQVSGTSPDVDGVFSAPAKIVFMSEIPNEAALDITASAARHSPKSQREILSIQISPDIDGVGFGPGVYDSTFFTVLIAFGTDAWDLSSVAIITLDKNTGYMTGTFTAGPNDPNGQIGSISGSFSG